MGYVIYSGEYATNAQATKALGSLRKSSIPKVIHIFGGSSSGGGGAGGAGGGSCRGFGQRVDAEQTDVVIVLKNLEKSHGKTYEERSKALPDVVETG